MGSPKPAKIADLVLEALACTGQWRSLNLMRNRRWLASQSQSCYTD
jgi:hypothetical protein